MSAMFDYITGKKSGREAELEASLEHMGGYLGIEIEDNEKLRAEIERLTAALRDCAYVAKHGEPVDGKPLDSVTQWIAERAELALEQNAWEK